MTTVFISHSRRDRELIKSITSALTNVDITPIIEEFIPEKKKEPVPYKEIRKKIRFSNAVFLFLTDNIMMTEHTKNWIIFEDGIAAASGKQLFLFERKGIPLEYPVPYLTDYMIFDKKSMKDLLRIQSISKRLKSYFSVEEGLLTSTSIPYDSAGMVLWGLYSIFKISRKSKVLKQLGLVRVECPRCKVGFYYYSPKHSPFLCPACRGAKLHLEKAC